MRGLFPGNFCGGSTLDPTASAFKKIKHRASTFSSRRNEVLRKNDISLLIMMSED
jgi:hypothetical protein